MVDAASKMSAKVIQKAVKDVANEPRFTNLPQDGSPFQNMLDNLSSGQEFAGALGVGNENIGLPSSGVNAISAADMPINQANFVTGTSDVNGIDKVVDLLSEVNNGQMQMENMVNQILYSGKRFSNQELLAIQAHVFHFAQITELVVKAADQGVSSVKAVLNTNIQ